MHETVKTVSVCQHNTVRRVHNSCLNNKPTLPSSSMTNNFLWVKSTRAVFNPIPALQCNTNTSGCQLLSDKRNIPPKIRAQPHLETGEDPFKVCCQTWGVKDSEIVALPNKFWQSEVGFFLINGRYKNKLIN